MHATERERLILDLIRARGFIGFQELDQRVDASPATIRRDLERLATEGRIERVRGGARLSPPTDAGPSDWAHLNGAPFHENIGRNAPQKAAIGRAAAGLCRRGEAVIIDGGSTTLQMCSHLDRLDLQVLTNSLHIVSALLPQPNTRIAIPGGVVFREQNIVLSAGEDDGASRYHASKMFLGAEAVGRHGVMQSDVLLVQAERGLLRRADELVLLVDSSKFSASAGHVVCPLKDIDTVVTDDGISPSHVAMLEQAGVSVVIAAL